MRCGATRAGTRRKPVRRGETRELTQGSDEDTSLKGEISPVGDAISGMTENAKGSPKQKEPRAAKTADSDLEDEEGEPGKQPATSQVKVCKMFTVAV